MKNLTDKQSLRLRLKQSLHPIDLGLKRKNLEQLKVELEELEKVKLPVAMKKFGIAYQEGIEGEADPNISLADDEVAVLAALISDLKTEIARLEKELKGEE